MAILPWQVQNIKKAERFTIEDQVLNPAGEPVTNATILISRKSAAITDSYIPKINRTISTDANGIFKIEDLPAGEYTLQVAGDPLSVTKDITITDTDKINTNRKFTAITPAKVRAIYHPLPSGEKVFADFEILDPGSGYSQHNIPDFTFPGGVIGEGVVDKKTGKITSVNLISTPSPQAVTFNDPYLPGAAAIARLGDATVPTPSSSKRICNYNTHADYMASSGWAPGSFPNYEWSAVLNDYESIPPGQYNNTDGDSYSYYSDIGARGNYRNPGQWGDKFDFDKPYWATIPAHPKGGLWVLANNYPEVNGIRKHQAAPMYKTHWGVEERLNKRYIVDPTQFYRASGALGEFVHNTEGYRLPKHYYQTFDSVNHIYTLWDIPGQTYNESTGTWTSDSSAPSITHTPVASVPSKAWLFERNRYPDWHAEGSNFSGRDYLGVAWIYDDCYWLHPLDIQRLKTPTMGTYVSEVQLVDNGAMYGPTERPQITLVGGGGTGATAEWDQRDSSDNYGGSLNRDIIVTNGGQGYTSPPTVQIESPAAAGGAPIKTVNTDSAETVVHDVTDSNFTNIPNGTGDYGTWNTAVDLNNEDAWFDSIKDLTMSPQFMQDHGIYAGYALTSYNEDPDTGTIDMVFSNAEGHQITTIETFPGNEAATSADKCVWPACGAAAAGLCGLGGPKPLMRGAESSPGANDGMYQTNTDTLSEVLADEQAVDPSVDNRSLLDKIKWLYDMYNEGAPPDVRRADDFYHYIAYDHIEAKYGLGADSSVRDDEFLFNLVKGNLGNKFLVESRMDYLSNGFFGAVTSIPEIFSMIQLVGHNAKQSVQGHGSIDENNLDILQQGLGVYSDKPVKEVWGLSKTYTDPEYTGSSTHNIQMGYDEQGQFYETYIPK